MENFGTILTGIILLGIIAIIIRYIIHSRKLKNCAGCGGCGKTQHEVL